MSTSFKTDADEIEHITKIAGRAEELGMVSRNYSRMTLVMDLTACNANGCPIDFERMAAADDFNLVHDVAGIANHMDRDTGKLTGCFLPRFAKRDNGEIAA